MKEEENKVPVFTSWRSWYVLVIFSLVLLIVFFYVFTKYFE